MLVYNPYIYSITVQKFLSSRLLSKNAKIKLYTTIIVPVAVYGCEIWSLILREEHKLTIFEIIVLRRIFGPKWDGVTGGWRKLPNEQVHDLYSSPNVIRIVNSRRKR
jgi:hypothetical protein